MIGPEIVMYSADTHPDFDSAGRTVRHRIKSSFDPETVASIVGESAREVFGF